MGNNSDNVKSDFSNSLNHLTHVEALEIALHSIELGHRSLEILLLLSMLAFGIDLPLVLVNDFLLKLFSTFLNKLFSDLRILLKVLIGHGMGRERHFSIRVHRFDHDVVDDPVSDFSFEFLPNSLIFESGGLGPFRFLILAVSMGVDRRMTF